jgi:hypothetical protein
MNRIWILLFSATVFLVACKCEKKSEKSSGDTPAITAPDESFRPAYHFSPANNVYL